MKRLFLALLALTLPCSSSVVRAQTQETISFDSDHDGVPDYLDQCPDTPAGEVVDTNGCSLAQLCPCVGP